MERGVRPYSGQVLLLAAVTAILGATAQSSASRIQVQTTGSGIVAGQAIDATTKRPVGGAIVTLTTAGPLRTEVPSQPPVPAAPARVLAIANADGRFVFREVPAGSYSLTATRMGYAGGAIGLRRPGGPSRPFTLDDGARLVDAVIPMWRLASVSGFVRDDRGEPAVGVAVSVLRRTLTGGRLELSFAGSGGEATDDRGHYRVTMLMPGSYVVTVQSATHTAAVSTVDAYLAAVTAGTAAAMTQQWTQTGSLRLATEGLVLDGWQVGVSIGKPQPLPGPNGTLLVHPTTFSGNTRSPADAAVLTLAPGDDRQGVDLTLPLVTGMRVSGVLNGPDGPAANHGVRLVPVATTEPAFESPSAYATTDATGRFALIGVPPGAYVLRAYRIPQVGTIERPMPPAAGAPPVTRVETIAPPAGPPALALYADVPVSVGSTHIDGLSVSLQPGARVSGRVAFEGSTPPPSTTQLQRIALSLRPLTGTVTASQARVDAAGRFQTPGYPPGRYMINVTPPGPEWTMASVRAARADAAGEALTLGTADIDDVVVTFTDKVITLTGTVRAATSGGDPDATVVVCPADVRAWLASGMSPRRLATAPTAASGAYQIRIPLPGDYLVVAVPPDIAPDIDPDFAARFASSAVRVTFAAGETKVQALTVSRPR